MKTAQEFAAKRKSHTTFDVEYLEPDNRPVKFKHKLLHWVFGKRLLGRLGLGVVKLATHEKIPGFGKGKKNFFKNPDTNYFFHLPTPVNVEVDNIPLPREVAREMINRADYHIIVDRCVCRDAAGCSTYSHEIGCIVMGGICEDFVPASSHRVSKEEALKHLDRGIAAGLVPTVARTKIDNFVFMTPDKGQMGGLCFCCDCCCAIPNSYGDLPTNEMRPLYHTMPGLKIEITDDCIACGKCAEHCVFDAIVVQNGRAYHKEDRCTACGRCALVCPEKAVKMTMTDPDAVRKIVDKILSISDLKCNIA